MVSHVLPEPTLESYAFPNPHQEAFFAEVDGLERLLMRKRIREVFVLLMVMAAALPQIVIAYRRRLGVLGEVWERLEGGWWPWSAAARWALGQDLLPAALALAGWTIAAFWFSRRLFERNLRFEPGPRLPVAGARAARHIHLPLRDPLAVMVEKELRALPRTPRFRLVFIMGFSFGLMVWLPILLRRGDSAWGKELLVLVSVYALMLLGQVTYWNAFGFDRSAALNYFWLPVSLRQVFAAKNLAALLFILLELTAIATVCLLLPLGVSPLKVLEAFLVTPVAALYLLAAGNLASVYFGRAMNPESASQAAGTARFQALVFFLYPVALLPVFLAYAARYAFASHVAFSAVLAFAALLGGVVYVIALDSTVAAAHRRRDILFAELCRSEGPVVTQ